MNEAVVPHKNEGIVIDLTSLNVSDIALVTCLPQPNNSLLAVLAHGVSQHGVTASPRLTTMTLTRSFAMPSEHM